MTIQTILPRLLLTLALAGAAIWLALNRDSLDPALIERSIRDLGPWAPVAHVVVFAIGTVLFLPGAAFGLAGGMLFGPFWGTVFNLFGATLGATASFLTARYIAKDWVRHKASGRLEQLITGVEAEGWRFVAFTRLVPLFPFNLLNYALGLTRIALPQYVIASLICMIPGTLAYSWLGYAGREALAGNAAAIRYGLLALALLAVIAFAPRLIRRLRGGGPFQWIEVDALADQLSERSGIALIDVRGPDEFVGPLGHIGEARNMPVAELPGRLIEINALKDKPVILICHTDKRSANAAKLLSDAGFRDVHVLRGGMEQWNQNGLPVENLAAGE